MSEIITLHAKDFEAEKELIEERIDESPWFILDSTDADLELEHYIGNLFDNYELGNRELARLRICRNFSWPAGAVTLIFPEGQEKPGASYNPVNISSLLINLQQETKAYLVIENNDRVLLANILQQLVYLDYPITNLDVALRSEYKDKERVELFMANLDELKTTAKEAVSGINNIAIPENAENGPELVKQKEIALGAYKEIVALLNKAREVEMKVAFAASKKTGKSVLVNCLLGRELAPTSLEMATPNTCIYRKSPDDKFHLHWLNENGEIIPDKSEHFNDRDQIHKALNNYFKKAEKDKDNQFALDDLIIEYPIIDGSGLDNFKIFDTPGPDASGTSHHMSATRAIDEADASVFAIDYAKYLTDSEKKYLDEVKEVFASKQKFHSLMFTINKIDQALQDSGAKSRVKSIDFIRNRLRKIDNKYGDCVIFATSALDFFNTQVLQSAADNYEELPPLLTEEADWGDDFRQIKKQLKGRADNELMTALSNLEAETTRIEDLLGYEHVNLDTMRYFSGMPQMLAYLKYILTGKAREELINHIAFTIDLQAAGLKTQIGQRENLIILLQKNESEINKITHILDDYGNKVDTILESKISKELDSEYFAKDGLLNTIISTGDTGLSLEELINRTREHLNSLGIKPEQARERIWNSYSAALLSQLIFEKRKLKDKELIDKHVLGLSDRAIKDIVEKAFEYLMQEYIANISTKMAKWGEDLKNVLSHRFARLEEASEKCRCDLAKENVNLTLPALPQFDVALPVARINSFVMESFAFSAGLQSQFSDAVVDKSFGENFREHLVFFWNYEDKKIERGKTDLKMLNDNQIKERVNATKPEFIGKLVLANFDSKIDAAQKEVLGNALSVQSEILDTFKLQIDKCKAIVNNFRAMIDEREAYKRDSDKTQRLLGTLGDIMTASEPFLDIWNAISNGRAQELPSSETCLST